MSCGDTICFFEMVNKTNNIIIVLLTISLLVSLFYIGYLKNDKVVSSTKNINEYNELLKSKEKLQNCFLQNLMRTQTCAMNCHDYECYKECNIKNIYNVLAEKCVN